MQAAVALVHRSPIFQIQNICGTFRGDEEEDSVIPVLQAKVEGLGHDRDRAKDCQSADMFPRIALFDRPEHRFFEPFQRHVLRIAHGF